MAKKNAAKSLFLLLCIGFIYPLSLFSSEHTNIVHDSNFMTELVNAVEQDVLLNDTECATRHCKKQKLTYYLSIADFAESFFEILTSDPLNSKYLAGRASLYDEHNNKVGTCSASFLCMQNEEGIYTDISNFLSVDSGLIVTWFTPTTLINLEVDSIINSMVTECIVVASTKVGFNPFYGKTFNLVVSSDNEKIYFKFSKR